MKPLPGKAHEINKPNSLVEHPAGVVFCAEPEALWLGQAQRPSTSVWKPNQPRCPQATANFRLPKPDVQKFGR